VKYVLTPDLGLQICISMPLGQQCGLNSQASNAPCINSQSERKSTHFFQSVTIWLRSLSQRPPGQKTSILSAEYNLGFLSLIDSREN